MFGILLFGGGLALLAAYALVPDFLYGASLFGGIFGVLVPFGLIILGTLLMYAGVAGTRLTKKTRRVS